MFLRSLLVSFACYSITHHLHRSNETNSPDPPHPRVHPTGNASTTTHLFLELLDGRARTPHTYTKPYGQLTVMNLDGKLVLVTGAASGIGRATALAFAAAGARLIITDIDVDGLDDVARALGDTLVLAARVDVADRAAMASFADEVHARVAAVDVLVNNAGVAFSGNVLETPLGDWDWVLGVNLYGVIHGCHFFVPPMVSRGQGGQVINISSVFGLYGAPGVTAYVASKFAVLGMSMSMRTELQPHGIGVSAICPGMIATNIVENTRSSPEKLSQLTKAAKLFRNKGASPDRVASAILDAVRNNRRVVPVARDGWAIWGLSHLAPTVLEKLGTKFMLRTNG